MEGVGDARWAASALDGSGAWFISRVEAVLGVSRAVPAAWWTVRSQGLPGSSAQSRAADLTPALAVALKRVNEPLESGGELRQVRK